MSTNFFFEFCAVKFVSFFLIFFELLCKFFPQPVYPNNGPNLGRYVIQAAWLSIVEQNLKILFW